MEESLRYIRNLGAITPQEQELLRNRRVCIVGCGGLGGWLIEYLARIGVGHLTVVDGDRFDRTNLNRQLLSSEENLGRAKASEAKRRLAAINSAVEVSAVEVFLTEENAAAILRDQDLVLDALDSIPARLMLQRVCAEQKLPLVHGAVEGWFGQVTTVLPGDDTLSRLYPGGNSSENAPATLSFAPGLIAALQAAEAVKLLLGREPSYRRRVLFADLLQNRFDSMPM